MGKVKHLLVAVILYCYIYSTISSVPSEEEEEMGVVKHLLLAKFKDDVSQAQIDADIKEYANLRNKIKQIKSFRWGLDVSIENLQQGFTHVFVETFESTDDIAIYLKDPAHVDFANRFLARLEKVLIVDFKPTKVKT